METEYFGRDLKVKSNKKMKVLRWFNILQYISIEAETVLPQEVLELTN